MPRERKKYVTRKSCAQPIKFLDLHIFGWLVFMRMSKKRRPFVSIDSCVRASCQPNWIRCCYCLLLTTTAATAATADVLFFSYENRDLNFQYIVMVCVRVFFCLPSAKTVKTTKATRTMVSGELAGFRFN